MPEPPELHGQQLWLPFITPWLTSPLITSQWRATMTTTPPDNDHDFPSPPHDLWQPWQQQQQFPFFTTIWLMTTPFFPFIINSLPSPCNLQWFLSITPQLTYPLFSVSSHNVFLCQRDERRVLLKSRFTWQSHNGMSHLADVAMIHPCSSAMTSRPP